MSFQLLTYRDLPYGAEVAPVNGIYSAANSILVTGVWDGVDEIEVTSPTVSSEASYVIAKNTSGLFVFPVALPQDYTTHEVVLDGGTLTSFLVTRVEPSGEYIKDIWVSNAEKVRDETFISVSFKFSATGEYIKTNRNKARCILSYGATAPIRKSVLQEMTNISPDTTNQFEFRIDPDPNDVLTITLFLYDAVGRVISKQISGPLKTILSMGLSPSRLEYDHATQEVANRWPTWASIRARDFFTLANDPYLTMMAPDSSFLGRLSANNLPYDTSRSPVGQRVINGMFGQASKELRKAVAQLQVANSLVGADITAVGHVSRAYLPPGPNEEEAISGVFGADDLLGGMWERQGNWSLHRPDEISPDTFGALTYAKRGNRYNIRADVRVETSLSQPSDLDQVSNYMQGAGTFGIVWRLTGADDHVKVYWGRRDEDFGLFVDRVSAGTRELLFHREVAYEKNKQILLEVQDDGGVASIYVDHRLITKVSLGEEVEPTRCGLFIYSPDPEIDWKVFVASITLSGVQILDLLGFTGLESSDMRSIKEVETKFEFLEAAPTDIAITTTDPVELEEKEELADTPFASDPLRRYLEADGTWHTATWWVDNNQVVRGEGDTLSPVARFWLWDAETKAPLIGVRLVSVVVRREWLWVLGYKDGAETATIFVVDPNSLSPLVAESCLYCQIAKDIGVSGAKDLLLGGPTREIYVR